MKDSLPRVASMTVHICGQGHVVVTMKDEGGRDVTAVHLGYNQTLQTVGALQRALIRIEASEHKPSAGHA
jgi:hypothetical protein